ncbi:MAG: hypothetical protein KDC64_11455, partial [Aequorivita sp.]|nr:hypothetical protein [Aequorivita sp.]
QKNVGLGDANLPIFVSISNFASLYFLEIGDEEIKGRGNDWGTGFINHRGTENAKKREYTSYPLCLCGEKTPIN